MKKYDVFISYSRKDYVDANNNIIPGNIISQIKEYLTKSGYTYWFDEEGIYSGDAFVGVITEAIQNSEIFLFISTKNSNESEWTNHEIATAKYLKKKTIPFKVDETVYHKSILMYLAPLDYIDYMKSPNQAFSALLTSIKYYYGDKCAKKNIHLEDKFGNCKLDSKSKFNTSEWILCGLTVFFPMAGLLAILFLCVSFLIKKIRSKTDVCLNKTLIKALIITFMITFSIWILLGTLISLI